MRDRQGRTEVPAVSEVPEYHWLTVGIAETLTLQVSRPHFLCEGQISQQRFEVSHTLCYRLPPT